MIEGGLMIEGGYDGNTPPCFDGVVGIRLGVEEVL